MLEMKVELSWGFILFWNIRYRPQRHIKTTAMKQFQGFFVGGCGLKLKFTGVGTYHISDKYNNQSH